MSTSTSSRMLSWAREPIGMLTLLAAVTVLVGSSIAFATPPSGNITRTELAKGRTSGSVSINTSAPSDFYVQNVIVDAGGSSGWHHHPGPEFSIIKSGSGTLYRDSCDPVVVNAGQAIFIPGGMNHLLRNDGTVPLEVYVTYVVPADTGVRNDEPRPQDCEVL